MAMPIKRFWFMSNMVERLWAERDLRTVRLMASVGTPDHFKMVNENLLKERGQIYVFETTAPNELVLDPVTGLDVNFDRAGLKALKAKSHVNR